MLCHGRPYRCDMKGTYEAEFFMKQVFDLFKKIFFCFKKVRRCINPSAKTWSMQTFLPIKLLLHHSQLP